MTAEQFKALDCGDLVRHKGGDGSVFVVTANYGDRATAVKTVDLTNPQEWEVALKATY